MLLSKILLLNLTLLAAFVSTLLIVNAIVYLKIILTQGTQWERFFTSRYRGMFTTGKLQTYWTLFVIFIAGIFFECFWLLVAYGLVVLFGEVGNAAIFFRAVQVLIIVVLSTIDVLAWCAPLEDIVGFTRFTLQNVGLPYFYATETASIILWREGSIAGDCYKTLLACIKYMFWALPVTLLVAYLLR